MKSQAWILSLALSFAAAGLPATATAAPIPDPQGDAGRRIVDAHADAVVTVQIVIEIGVVYEGRDANREEMKREATGIVIDPKGLTVVSLNASDQSDYYNAFFAQQRRPDGPKMKFESSIRDVKIRYPGRPEVSAEFILQDRDLDLAFVRPKEALDAPVAAIDLATRSSADLLTPVALLRRLGTIAGRMPSVSLGRVEAKVTKPRTFYVLDHTASHDALGAPVFTLDGRLLGMSVLRVMPGAVARGGTPMGGPSSDGMLTIVVPTDQLLDSAKQVPAR